MSSKSKKKKRNSLLILFVCIIICAGGYVLLSAYDTKKEKAEEEAGKEEEIKLLSIEEEQIFSVEFKNSFCSMKLLQKDGKWTCEEEKKFPLNQEYAGAMAEIVSDLSALRQISGESEADEYGLENPAIEAVFTTEDGENTLYIGDQSPSSDRGYYCCLNDDKTIYEIDSSVFTTFNYSREQMMELEDSPEIISSQVTKLNIKNPKEFNFVALNEAISDSSSWVIQEPYDIPVVGNESNLTTFFQNYESISYEGAVEYNCKDFSKYGLDEKNPETALIYVDCYELVETETSDDSNSEDDSDMDSTETSQERVDYQVRIIIGSQNDDENYYVRVDDSSYVYLMDEEKVDQLIPDDSYTYVDSTISRVSVDNMTGITFSTEDAEYQITSKEKTTTNDEGEEETQTDYFFNNKTIDLTDFNSFTTSWNALENSKEMTAKERKQVDEKNVVLTVNIEGSGNNQTVQFLQFNQNYYAVKDEEAIFFLIDKRDVDGLINKLLEQDKQ